MLAEEGMKSKRPSGVVAKINPVSTKPEASTIAAAVAEAVKKSKEEILEAGQKEVDD